MRILPSPDGDPQAGQHGGDQQSPFREDQGRLELNKASSELGVSHPLPLLLWPGEAAGKPGQGENTDVSVLG